MTDEQIVLAIREADEKLFRWATSRWAGGENNILVFFVDDPAAVCVETDVYRRWSKNGKWSGKSRTTKYFVVRAEIEKIIKAGMLIHEKKILLSANETRVIFAVRAARGRLGCESLTVVMGEGMVYVL